MACPALSGWFGLVIMALVMSTFGWSTIPVFTQAYFIWPSIHG